METRSDCGNRVIRYPVLSATVNSTSLEGNNNSLPVIPVSCLPGPKFESSLQARLTTLAAGISDSHDQYSSLDTSCSIEMPSSELDQANACKEETANKVSMHQS